MPVTGTDRSSFFYYEKRGEFFKKTGSEWFEQHSVHTGL
jgi:hypothetical protein